jgi:hypothetical protein
MTGVEPLTFATLDSLAFAAERGRLDRAAGLALAVADLGPLLELVQLGASGLLPGPDRAPWLALNGAAPFHAALADGRPRWVCPETRRAGFVRLAATMPADDTPWIQFALAAQKAAAAAGFAGKTAAQLAGALGEMHSNVYEHSGRPETGFAAFRAGEGVFEFAVADSGIGVLASLNTCPDHAGLTDHGDALRLALTEGVSRHGAGRGMGFRPLFIGLANLFGALRFRSGNHALTIDGRTPSLMSAKTAEKPALQGFFISVACRVNGQGR